MPILTGSGDLAASVNGRTIRVPGLPDLGTDPDFIGEDLAGYMDAPAPTSSLVANGGGAGAVAVGDWLPAEEYLTLVGHIFTEHPRDIAQMRSLLLTGLPADRDTALVVVGNDWDVDKQMFVRRYDRADMSQLNGWLRFSIPLVAPDPFKYALESLSSTAGGFAVADWFREYADNGGDWFRTYSTDGGVQYRTYNEAEEDASSLPKVADLTSPGDADSSRVTVTVAGPVTAGEWWVEDASGTRLWAEVSLTSGESVVFDCRTRTATLGGSPIDHLVSGDFFRLQPGANAFRLVVGASGVGSHMTIDALPAYL